MTDWQKYHKILSEKLSDNRYRHSVAVMERAVFLAELYGVDVKKAKLAGLLHDIMKNEENEMLLQFISNSAIILSVAEENAPPLWHAIGGFLYARDILKIEDEDVLNAIRYHTTGRKGMSDLEKVVYLADFTSADREYPDVEVTRKLSEESLDKAIIYCTKYLINDLLEKGKLLHQDTVDCYNELAGRELKENEK